MLGEGLSDALILLPTRRAVRDLTEALAEDTSTTLLPRLQTLADIDPDEPPFEPGYLTGMVAPAMSGAQRRYALAKIMAHFHTTTSDLPLSPASMLSLADPLMAILDDAAMEEIDLTKLHKLEELKSFAAKHFQDAAELFTILQNVWPNYLAEQGLMEPMARRVALLNALTRFWTENPPDHPVIIAGSTGTLTATAKLMDCVRHMPNGMIILPGVDTHLQESAWERITPDHPQGSLKALISRFGLSNRDIPDWPHIADALPRDLEPRRRVLSESLVPVKSTAEWPEQISKLRDSHPGRDIFEDAFEGLNVIEAQNVEEEALSIAILMRETLHTPKATATLITPDPSLARRVKARLERWDISVDYSQGQPLEETPLGSFLTTLLSLACEPTHPVHMTALAKHPLTGDCTQAVDWLSFERKTLRGKRLSVEAYTEKPQTKALLEPLKSLMSDTQQDCATWATALTQAAESLAATTDITGADRLWVGDSGEKAARLIEDLMRFGDNLGLMGLQDFSDIISLLMRGAVVRPRFGMHPRLQILGPLEARMLSADRIILGGLNEGTWPAPPVIDPFLSRTMRGELGLSLPERRYGLAAHDYAVLASAPEVFLTRARQGDSGPTVASRWLWRLQTLARGAFGDEAKKHLSPDKPYLEWARSLDYVKEKVSFVKRPAPTPPLEARWPRGRKLSVTRLRVWVRDPYSIYAKYILDLNPLRELDQPVGPAEFGTAIHDGIDKFCKRFPSALPEDATRQLLGELETQLLAQGYDTYKLVTVRPRLNRIATELIEWMRLRQSQGWQLAAIEKEGSTYFDALDFTLSAKADRIEKSAEGYAVIDYKTGTPPKPDVVQAGFDMQLPMTALLLEKGGFAQAGLSAQSTEDLLYVRVRGVGDGVEPCPLTGTVKRNDVRTTDDYVTDVWAVFERLVKEFDQESTGYTAQPRIQYSHDYGDYDDLARRGEWDQLGSEGEGS